MKRVILGAALGVLLGAPASASDEQCLVPEQGTWTVGGQGSFTIDVQGCGEVIIATGLGDPQTGMVKTIPRLADGSYDYGSTNRGLPFTLDIDLLDPRNMLFTWSVGGMRRPAYAAQFAGAPAGAVPAICGCEVFVRQLREEIESNDYFISLYSNPLLYSRPPELDADEKWTSDLMEQVVNMAPSGNAQIRSARGEIARGGRKALVERANAGQATPGAGDSPVVTAASTDCATCEIDPPDFGTLCAADVLEQATMAHESVHSDICKAQNKLRDAWNPMSGKEQPKSYCLASNVSANLAAEEVQAYRAGNAFIRDWYRSTCKAEL